MTRLAVATSRLRSSLTAVPTMKSRALVDPRDPSRTYPRSHCEREASSVTTRWDRVPAAARLEVPLAGARREDGRLPCTRYSTSQRIFLRLVREPSSTTSRTRSSSSHTPRSRREKILGRLLGPGANLDQIPGQRDAECSADNRSARHRPTLLRVDSAISSLGFVGKP